MKKPGREGIFGDMTFSHELIHLIGGEDDTNRNTTRRVLLLLESVPPIGWQDVKGFRYSKSPREEPLLQDIHLSTFLATCGEASALDLQALQRNKVLAISSTTEEPSESWPVYRCLYAEVEDSGVTFLLNGGQWYRVDEDFVNKVNDQIAKIQPTSGALLDCLTGETESSYNLRLAGSIAGACCLDGKNILYGGGRSKVEFCDVLAPDRRMFYVKKYSGSSVLSHLFAQGTVAATTLISDQQFRGDVNKLIPGSSMRFTPVSQKPRAADYEVAYVVASRSARKLTLPFFSRVTLRNAYSRLTSYGYRVTLTKVQTA